MRKGMLLIAALALISSGAAAQRAQPAAAETEDVRDARILSSLGLSPIEREGEAIRYTFHALDAGNGGARGLRHIVVQVAPGTDERTAIVRLVTGRGALAGAPRVVERAQQTISMVEYRSLRAQLVRIATDLDMIEQEVGRAITVCSHSPWSRFDLKLGGESRMMLTRTGGCRREATAYRAGDFLVTAVERILARPIEGARPR
jgi:hypothetical protein